MIENRLDEALDRINSACEDASCAIRGAASTANLEEVRVTHLGKRSPINAVTQLMGKLNPDERKRLGAALNEAKRTLEEALDARASELSAAELTRRLEDERVDVTLPGTECRSGYRHPLLQSVRQILSILQNLGFATYEGFEVEWERYNFDMLNVPADHPARDVQDTFWVTDRMLLRTQTSPAQIRIMQQQSPPLRVAVPGWCYRNEAEDASHGDRFYQIEGLAVDRHITLADLKGTLTEVAHRFFGPDRRVRFRPSFFPFTEPSAELDIECGICRGAGCRSCGGEGWLELGGSGMVHPNVLRAGGYDPDEVSGFAFGIGPDRYTMMKFGIPDLRLFRENDIRFLRQFN